MISILPTFGAPDGGWGVDSPIAWPATRAAAAAALDPRGVMSSHVLLDPVDRLGE